MESKNKFRQIATIFRRVNFKRVTSRYHQSIGFKIAAGYVLLAFFVLLLGLTSLFQTNGMQKNTLDIITKTMPALEDILELNYYTEHIMSISM